MADDRLVLVCVPPDKLQVIWPRVSPLIYTAIKRGDFGSFESIRDDVVNGDALLWIAVDETEIIAGCVTQITKTEWRKVCTIVALGGSDMTRWLKFLEPIEAYAKGEGCQVSRVIGRDGWTRILTTYRPHRVILEKAL